MSYFAATDETPGRDDFQLTASYQKIRMGPDCAE